MCGIWTTAVRLLIRRVAGGVEAIGLVLHFWRVVRRAEVIVIRVGSARLRGLIGRFAFSGGL